MRFEVLTAASAERRRSSKIHMSSCSLVDRFCRNVGRSTCLLYCMEIHLTNHFTNLVVVALFILY
jgi:hypothetical protein